MRTPVAGAVFGFLVCGAAPGFGQAGGTDAAHPESQQVLQAVHATGQIHIDGRLDEAAWEEAARATGFVQQAPDPGAPASQETEALLVHTDDALYVGMRLYERDPGSIAAQLARRDAFGIHSDWATVMLDSYNDNRTAFAFSVSPSGVKRDYIIFSDARRAAPWDAVWHVETTVDSLGWTAEFRIPLSQLRFSLDESEWGINFLREIARNGEKAFWSPVPPDAAGFVSRFGELVGLTGLEAPRRLEIQPYTVARLTRAPEEAGNPFYSPNQLHASVGADFRYGISSALTLTGTVNPDFGQVEADPSVMNLSAFETFFPEQRAFFVEGSSFFDFDMGSGKLFYSRRIGRSPQGATPSEAVFRDRPEATTILGAMKLSGKTASGWSIGVLDALTTQEEVRYVTREGVRKRSRVEPLTNYGIVRVSRDFRDGHSAIGGIFTAANRRLEQDDALSFLRSAAYAGGIDGRHRFGKGNYEIRGALVRSYILGSSRAIKLVQLQPGHYFQRPDADHLVVDPELTSLSGWVGSWFVGKIGGGRWGWGAFGHAASPGFEVNDLGFHRGADEIYARTYVTYSQNEPNRIFRQSGIGVHAFYGETFGGERVQAGLNTNGHVQLHNHWTGFFDITPAAAVLSTSELRGGPALVQPAALSIGVGLSSDRRKAVSGGMFVRRVTDVEGKRTLYLSPSLEIRPSPRLELSIEPSVFWNADPAQYVDQRELDGGRRYVVGHLEQTTTSLTARINYTFTPELSLQLYAQPFISAGTYSTFREVADAGAADPDDRFRLLPAGEIRACEGFYAVRPQGDGCGDEAAYSYRIRRPDFNLKQLRSNAVLRWEYRPGSTLFVVWNQRRRDFVPDGGFELWGDAHRLFGAPGTDVLLLKLSYWFGL